MKNADAIGIFLREAINHYNYLLQARLGVTVGRPAALSSRNPQARDLNAVNPSGTPRKF